MVLVVYKLARSVGVFMTIAKLATILLLPAIFLSRSSGAGVCKSGSLMLPKLESGNVIGTRTLVLADSARHRELLVTTWFPAQPGTVTAPKQWDYEQWKSFGPQGRKFCSHAVVTKGSTR